MPQLLLELLSEEIPARMQAGAARDLARMAAERFKAQELGYDSLETFVTPRRLTLVIEGLPVAQADRTEERKGPRANAPEQALQGFLRSTGLTREQLVERDGVLFGSLARPGRPTPEIAAEIVHEIMASFPWPKSMRSGTSAFRWVRPLKSILFLFDGQIVPFDAAGLIAGRTTRGHRFMGTHAGEPIEVGGFHQYREQLARQFVTLDAAERRAVILERAQALCAAQGLELVPDEGLAYEVAGLVEHPVPLLGAMDPAFLDLPPEVIRTSMRTHQKYFAVRDPATSQLAPRFVVVANIEASDGGAEIARGNAKVLSARLSDARFFWDEDTKPGAIEGWLEKLEGVTFHAKLGTMHERVERIAALAREIAPLVGADPDLAEQAARLAKADLASAMVGEFPELQGVMGGYYVRAAGRPAEVADAVRDHYKPVGPSDSVPTAPVTVAVALADKLDTLVGFFAIDERPTGSRDPYALRRAALGFLKLAIGKRLRCSWSELVATAAFVNLYNYPLGKTSSLFFEARSNAGSVEDFYELVRTVWLQGAFGYIISHDPTYREYMEVAGKIVRREPVDIQRYYGTKIEEFTGNLIQWLHEHIITSEDQDAWIQTDDQSKAYLADKESVAGRLKPLVDDILLFFVDRLKVQLRDEGKRHDLVDAVFALGDDDLVRIVDKVEALSGFLATEDGANLLAGYRRAVNILKAEEKKHPGEVIAPLPLADGGEAGRGGGGTTVGRWLGVSETADNPPASIPIPGPSPIEGEGRSASAERDLHVALQHVQSELEPRLAAEDFSGAMTSLSQLRGPVDAFFEQVLVNDPDPEVRLNRLRLLSTLRDQANRVADFSLIQG